jgi:methionyl-tRNA formyltransferase
MHSGILPFYRGADSEFWALYNGEKDKIGVSIIFLTEELDAGDVLLESRQKVSPGDDHRSLRMKNIILGAQKMVEAISLIETGNYERIPQDGSIAKTYKSATKEDIERYRQAVKGKV